MDTTAADMQYLSSRVYSRIFIQEHNTEKAQTQREPNRRLVSAINAEVLQPVPQALFSWANPLRSRAVLTNSCWGGGGVPVHAVPASFRKAPEAVPLQPALDLTGRGLGYASGCRVRLQPSRFCFCFHFATFCCFSTSSRHFGVELALDQ